MAKLHVITYGCQMNEYDSERVAGLLREHRYELTENAADADLILVNTCAIREKAEDKVFSKLGELRALKIERPELVLGVTGDDEDNLIICQIASEGYRVPKVIARVNDPRNQEHFDLLGITQTVCATANVLGLVEHEVPEHGIVHLLELRKENLEIVELQIDKDSPVAGKRIGGLRLPDGARLISVMRNGRSELAEDSTVIRPGDQVLAVLEPGKEDELRHILLKR